MWHQLLDLRMDLSFLRPATSWISLSLTFYDNVIISITLYNVVYNHIHNTQNDACRSQVKDIDLKASSLKGPKLRIVLFLVHKAVIWAFGIGWQHGILHRSPHQVSNLIGFRLITLIKNESGSMWVMIVWPKIHLSIETAKKPEDSSYLFHAS